MGLAQKSLAYIEPEDYLRMEEFSSEKHEYLDGVIYAWQGQTVRGMAGESIDHNRIMRNIGASLHAQAAPLGCEVFMADVRLRPFKNSAYFYPDVMVRCGPTASGEATEISDAALVVEVLSNTTEGFDRQDKFDRYRCMTSLQCYVLVSPMLRTIEVFRADQGWQASARQAYAPGDPFELGIHGWVLRSDEVFARVTST